MPRLIGRSQRCATPCWGSDWPDHVRVKGRTPGWGETPDRSAGGSTKCKSPAPVKRETHAASTPAHGSPIEPAGLRYRRPPALLSLAGVDNVAGKFVDSKTGGGVGSPDGFVPR